MRALISALALMVAIAPGVGQAQPVPSSTPLSPVSEKCIRDNAASVEAGISELTQAVEYLVSDICAVQLADDQVVAAKIVAEEQAARLKAACDKRKTSGKKASDSPDEDYDACADGLDFSGASFYYTSSFNNIIMAPPAARALAASLLLDSRLSHSKSGSSH